MSTSSPNITVGSSVASTPAMGPASPTIGTYLATGLSGGYGIWFFLVAGGVAYILWRLLK